MRELPVTVTREEFCQQAQSHKLIPVSTQLAADFETPLSAYLKIRDGQHGFLLESAESTDASGRWSILGSSPKAVFEARGQEWKWTSTQAGAETTVQTGRGEVLKVLERLMSEYQIPRRRDLPPFYGGLVGSLSYDAIELFEPTVGAPPEDDLGLPDALFLLAAEVLVFDHKLRRLILIANAFPEEFETPEQAYTDALHRLRRLMEMLDRPLHVSALNGLAEAQPAEAQSNTTAEQYRHRVDEAKEFIKAGDVFQVVLSQRFEQPFSGTPVDLYRALRHVNPSPYMFILEFPEHSLVGSSPEVHVRCMDRKIDIRPIAGTRWRGQTPAEDDALAHDLLSDQKERAEHVMLVDLARNDLGRIAEHGTVQVDDFMIVERYSHVMHIVSNVTGKLGAGQSSYDVLRATFPAGTVSGAPKIRAMQIINTLENTKRNAYAGAIGYFGFDGNHDSCIALRTVLLKGGRAYVQAGAGIVADSDPHYEEQETRNKAAAMLRALALAQTI